MGFAMPYVDAGILNLLPSCSVRHYLGWRLWSFAVNRLELCESFDDTGQKHRFAAEDLRVGNRPVPVPST